MPLSAGPEALARGRGRRANLGTECRRLHYLSVPERGAAGGAPAGCGRPGRARASSWRSPSAPTCRAPYALNARLHEVFAEEQIYRIDHFLGKEPAQNIPAFRFANGLFEPIWNRNFIDHVQIDVPETLGLSASARLLRADRRLPRHGGDAPVPDPRLHGDGAADPLEPAPISEEKNKVFRSMLPIQPDEVVRGQYIGYRDEEGIDPDSDTETFIALKCHIDNWRWAACPSTRAHRQAAGGGTAHHLDRLPRAAQEHVPAELRAWARRGPDHLTFDPPTPRRCRCPSTASARGPGTRLDKLSLQFAMTDTPAPPARCWRPTSG